MSSILDDGVNRLELALVGLGYEGWLNVSIDVSMPGLKWAATDQSLEVADLTPLDAWLGSWLDDGHAWGGEPAMQLRLIEFDEPSLAFVLLPGVPRRWESDHITLLVLLSYAYRPPQLPAPQDELDRRFIVPFTLTRDALASFRAQLNSERIRFSEDRSLST
ncbi:MAG: WapI family immunity protein [Coriobacteriia bacterium]